MPATTAHVAVIGVGYVGLPLALDFAGAGARVTAFDVDDGRIARLRDGRSPIDEIPDDEVAGVRDRIRATTDPAEIGDADALIICVPTPLTRQREPDLAPLRAATRTIGSILRRGHLVVLESTTFPGTTSEIVAPMLEDATGLRAGRDFALAYSPERIDPGNEGHGRARTPKVIGGLTPRCTQRAVDLYGDVFEQLVVVSSTEAAELTKLLENVFRSVNIALVNELAMLADRMGIDVWEVIDAAATKPFGFTRFEPGPGMGGHCLPVDPFYLSWKAREFDAPTEFIELAGKTNQIMPGYCVARAERMLNHDAKAVRGARILVIGASYKAGVSDIRESPALKILQGLADRGAVLSYHDPYVRELPEHGLVSVEDPLVAAEGSDLVLIVTAHADVDHAAIARRAPRVLDLRNAVGERMIHVERL